MAAPGGTPGAHAGSARGSLTWTEEGGPGWPQKPPEPDCRGLAVGSGSSSCSAVPGPTGHALIGPCCDPPRSRALPQPEKPSVLSRAAKQAGELRAQLRRPSGLRVLSPPHGLGLASVLGSAGPRRRPPSDLPSVPAQTRATTAAPAPTASTRLSAVACPASRGPSARRTSTSAPATRAATGPTARTAWTATPAPAPPASAASTARTTLPTAQRGECHGRPGPRVEVAGRRAGVRVRCPMHPAGVPWAIPHCPSSQTGSPGSSEGQRENQEAWQFLQKSWRALLCPTAPTLTHLVSFFTWAARELHTQ